MTEEHDDAGPVWGTTTFTPGGHVGLVSRRTVGIVAGDHPSTRIRLWELVSADSPLDDVLDDLSTTGLKSLPDFALAQVEEAAIRVVARGAVVVSVQRSDRSTHEIDPAGVRTWIEELVDDAVSVSISFADAGDTDTPGEFAVLAGSVPAGSLTRRFDVEDVHAEEAEAAGWASGAQVVSPPADPVLPDADGDTGPGPGDASGSPDDDSDPVQEVADLPTDAGDEPPAALAPDVEIQLPDDEPEGSDIDGPRDVAASAEWFEDGAVDEVASAGVPPQPSVDTAAADVEPPPPDAAPSAVQPPPPIAPGAAPSGPGTGAPPPGEVPPPRPPSGPPPPVASPPAPADVAAPDAQPPAPMPPTSVSSLFDDAADTTAIAPSGLGRAATAAVLVFSNGVRVDIDRPVLIGRNPKATGVDGVLPHIMKFDGPGQGLSRTHAEVRVEDGVLIVEDLNSTNGTEVEIPGQPRARLTGGVPVAIGPGVLIDFGDDLHCTVEAGT